ncbi:Uncharacterised protein [Acinetobacter baumannii]|nr:Uncharacterised protein [Acinetobacter baumannii]
MPTSLIESDPFQYQSLNKALMRLDNLLVNHVPKRIIQLEYQKHLIGFVHRHSDRLNQYLHHMHEKYFVEQERFFSKIRLNLKTLHPANIHFH